MASTRRKIHELLRLLPTGAAGLSMSLAAADASATAVSAAGAGPDRSVADRLQSLRGDVYGAIEQYAKDAQPFVAVDAEQLLAWWGNGGWHNGGWHNGGFGNGGWHNGGFGNGGWHNGGFRNW